MISLVNFFKQLKEKRKRNKLLKKPQRSLERFKKRYPNYKIGSNCYGTPQVKHPHPDATLTIGSYCSIGRNVQVFLGGNHRTDWITTFPFPAFFKEFDNIKSYEISKGDVIIASDVWICSDSTILSGVTIGYGAVVANGSLVTKDVPPYSIVAGNPAKHIRWRFDEQTRILLLESAWWDWPEEEVIKIIPLLCSDNIDGFINYVKSRKLSHT